MVVTMKISNHLGDWHSKPITMTSDQYDGLVEVSKSFYSEGGFEMPTIDGVVIIPPELTRQSVLTIKIIEEDD